MLLARRRARRDSTNTSLLAVRSRSCGQALVEFAMVLPVFLFLTVGIIDGARMFNANVTLTNGVSEAAVFAASNAANAVRTCPGGGSGCAGAPMTGVICTTDYSNIACHLVGDSNFLDLHQLTMSVPKCAPSGAVAPGDCVAGTTAVKGNVVTITATYLWTPILAVPILTPWANGVTLTATTKAVILP